MRNLFQCYTYVLLSLVLITSCSSIKENEKLHFDKFENLSQKLKHSNNLNSDAAIEKRNEQSDNLSCKNNFMFRSLGLWLDDKKKQITELDSISSYNKLYTDIYENFGSCTNNQMQSIFFTSLVHDMVEKSTKDNVQWALPLKKDELIHLWERSYIFNYWWDLNSADSLLDHFLKNVKKMTGDNYWSSVLKIKQIDKEKTIDIFKKQYSIFSKEMFNYTSSFDKGDLSESKVLCLEIDKTVKAAKKNKIVFGATKEEVVASLILIHYSRFCPYDKNTNLSKVQELHEIYLPDLYSKK